VYKSLQDNNEDQCIITLGESGSGKTENCRMVIRFLSKLSARFVLLHRQRSSNSIRSASNSCSSTPQHKPNAAVASIATNNNNNNSSSEKSSCFKNDLNSSSNSSGTNRNKKISRVEFDFSYQSCNDNDMKQQQFCPKHNCTNPIDIPKHRNSIGAGSVVSFQVDDYPTTSKSFTIYETMNRVHNNNNKSTTTTTSKPNCLDHRQMQNKCESLDLISGSGCNQSIKMKKASVVTETPHYKTPVSSRTNKSEINLDCFKSAKRKAVPTALKLNTQLSHLEIHTMKERIAQAEIFLEAMGNASTTQNRDSSRFVSCYQMLLFPS